MAWYVFVFFTISSRLFLFYHTLPCHTRTFGATACHERISNFDLSGRRGEALGETSCKKFPLRPLQELLNKIGKADTKAIFLYLATSDLNWGSPRTTRKRVGCEVQICFANVAAVPPYPKSATSKFKPSTISNFDLSVGLVKRNGAPQTRQGSAMVQILICWWVWCGKTAAIPTRRDRRPRRSVPKG